MKRKIIRYSMIVLLIGFVALAADRANAQGFIEVVSYTWGVDQPVGLARGQTLRFTWANLSDPNPQKRVFEPLRTQVRLLAADGSVLAQTAAAAVDAGKFQSFDFNRDQINLPGEPGTGRLQVRLEATVELRRRNLVTNLSMDIERPGPAGAVEIIDTLTGRTTVSFKPKEIVVVGSKINEK